ncbi:putative nucleotidyltransferase, Ribonuclease H [Lupinus albus]|uniref:Putative nucleotidyltransferase, Ribonuclease H n=1 Tax=Lupinus albus TaxID=3870 RepID=A0A6A4PXP2_LUPAL|nr:putative nucleotidyltransferase, Ribonuclease H [Lupinus albus]
MLFGLTNAPSTFQTTMNQLLSQFLRRFVIVFFDDILIYSSSLDDHLMHLEIVLQCLLSNVFYVKLSKCLFCQESIEYLGHIVSSRGVHADPSKLDAMMKWAPPTNVKQLRGFLGLTSYYRCFIAHYASIAAPLTDLLRLDSFTWSATSSTAFQALKKAMMAAPVLCLPDFTQDFIIETNASMCGIGAVLMQEGHPIAFFSKKLGPKMQIASVYIKELHAIIEAVLKWRQYLLGHFFIIRTNHKSIKELLQQVIQTPDQQVYVKKLLGFQFHIEYKPDVSNRVEDALSRVPAEWPSDSTTPSNFMALVSIPTFCIIQQHQQENSSDPFLLEFHSCATQDTLEHPFAIVQGMVTHKGRYVLSPTFSLCKTVVSEYHDTPSGGHAGVKRTLARVAASFFWPRMRQTVTSFVADCLLCQQIKYSTQVPAGLLQPLPIPEEV